MIKAIVDKVVVQEMKREKSKGGLIIPESVQDPQSFGVVVSVGEKVEAPIKEGDILVFHNNGGMSMMIDGKFYRCLMENELYGIIQSKEIIDQLSLLEMKQQDLDKIDEAMKNAQTQAASASQGSRIIKV